MDSEIITIGDEIMTGHTVDFNGTEIATALTEIGLRVRYRSSVRDSVEEMEEAFRLALHRAEIVITTGGLGPTDDDLTKRAIVKVFKRNLVFHEDVLEDIRVRYAQRGIDMPAINQNQALLPQGATFFANKHGSAVGICLAEQGKVFISLPGVPYEMRQILHDDVIPYLQNLGGVCPVATFKLRTTGIIESKLAELIASDIRLDQGASLAYLPTFSGVDLRIMASDNNRQLAAERSKRLAGTLEKKCSKYVYGYNSDTLEAVIGQLLGDNDKTLSLAESCTGGQLGELVTSVPGSSRYFV
ncbi:MAG: CinA family protein, partial [Candidatus Zixiibacteriota bacterium]